MQDPQRLWSPVVRGLVPYVPGEQPKLPRLVKLNTNENPYPPSPRVLQAVAEAAQQGLQMYPDPDAQALRETVARHHGVAVDQVFAGNGSDEVLALAFLAFFQQSRPLLMPDVSYSFYRVWCQLWGLRCETVPLDERLRLHVADYAQRPAGGVVIANPNAPTGVALPLSDIEQLLRSQPDCVVLVDEAYVDFGTQSAIALVDRHPNLLVVHTMSKARSLAGLRVGLAFGQAPLLDGLRRVKDSFNSYPLGRPAQAGARAAYEDNAHFEQTRAAVIASREQLVSDLHRLGFDVLPSAANFVFARHPGHDAVALAAALRARSIVVRHFRQPRIDQHLRISIGTPAQCAALVDALQAITDPSRPPPTHAAPVAAQ